MDSPQYRVSWVSSEGSECHTDGALLLVNLEQVIVTHGPHAVCCIPRESVSLIERITAAPNAESGDWSIPTAVTTPAPSAATSGRVDVSGNLIEGDY